MLGYKNLEHFDEFGTEVVYWVEVAGVPQRFINEAQDIDGEDFLDDGFGVCVHHDTETGEYAAVEDGPGQNLYYVDNLGDKHWFDYSLSKQELEQMTAKICEEREKEKQPDADLSQYYVASMPDAVRAEIREKITAALAETGQCTPDKIEKAMNSKIYDLEDLIDIRKYVKQIGQEETSRTVEDVKRR